MSRDWQTPTELPDLRGVGILALDTETKDDRLHADMGSGWPFRSGYLCGVSVAYRAAGEVHGGYFPIRHPDSENFSPEQIYQWLRDHVAADVRFVTQNGLYDWGWLRVEAGIHMPPGERLEEIGALATMVDENRFRYSLDALCQWRGLPGKDDTLLREGIAALGLVVNKRKKLIPQSHIWQLPARYDGPYAEADAVNTLLLCEDLDPILDREGTRAAYRLECDLLPMVQEMRLRGIRVDLDAAERARDLLLGKRDEVFAELSQKLECPIGMHEIGRNTWLAETFDRLGIQYPLTEKGNPSFAGGQTGWMSKHAHWLPQLITKADKYNNAATKFLQNYILNHAVNGRIHAEIHPHRSEDSGAKSFRFSYSDPPLQQMTSRDAELAPLIRGVFLPEEGETWAKPDASQQEFRLVVHYANQAKLTKAAAAVARYRDDPDADFHALAATITELERTAAKAVNFAKIYGAGPDKFAAMIGKPAGEARRIYEQYDRELPFLHQLSDVYTQRARSLGYITLYDGARRHFNKFAPGGKWVKGAGPCWLDEARQRLKDSGHPWYGSGRLYRVDTHTALNALIQGSAARHTKLWMRACWREGIVPLLQMHDCLDCSVSSLKEAELVARLGCEAVQLDVPMRVDLKFGRNWGDAKHTWQELHNGEQSAPIVFPAVAAPEPVGATSIELPDELVTSAAIPLMITRTMKEQLYSRGFSEQDVVEMTPQQAHDQLEIKSISAAPIEKTSMPPPDEQPPSTQRAPEEQPPAAHSPTNGASAGGGKATSGNGHGYPWGEREIGGKVAEFIYRNLKGDPYLKIVKHKTKQGRKSFPQYHWENGRWESGKPKGPAIPYRLPELLAAPTATKVWICEGEKNADTLAALGLIATTNPGGATKWGPELNKWLAGFAGAYILEDNDATGRKHVLQVATALTEVVSDIRILSFRELPEHGDVTDWMQAGGTLALLLERANQAPRFATLESTCAADEAVEAIDWIWFGRYAIGKIGLLVGLPDEGKGLTLSDIIARITRASPWPCNEGQAPLGNVILLTAEDDINDTVVPRLLAAGTDLRRVTIIKMMHEAGTQRMFSLITDLGALRQKVLEIGNVRMIVIDPITAYLGIGKVDSFRATDVRAVLSPLKEFAAELRLSILGVMHFNKKVDITNVLLRISDSLAYGAAARHVYGVIDDPDKHRKLFVKGKNNLAPKDQKTLAFSFDAREIGTDKRTGQPIRAPYILWHPDPVDITATEALQAAAESKSPGARDNAKQFLEALLSNEPVDTKDVQEAAKENGISPRTLRRAKDELSVEIKKDGPIVGGTRGWRWHLPTKKEQMGDGS